LHFRTVSRRKKQTNKLDCCPLEGRREHVNRIPPLNAKRNQTLDEIEAVMREKK
jgi:hypothetical protein